MVRHEAARDGVQGTIGITGPREWSHHCGTTLYAAPCSSRCSCGDALLRVKEKVGNMLEAAERQKQDSQKEMDLYCSEDVVEPHHESWKLAITRIQVLQEIAKEMQ